MTELEEIAEGMLPRYQQAQAVTGIGPRGFVVSHMPNESYAVIDGITHALEKALRRPADESPNHEMWGTW